jgi:hypothetical protein
MGTSGREEGAVMTRHKMGELTLCQLTAVAANGADAPLLRFSGQNRQAHQLEKKCEHTL